VPNNQCNIEKKRELSQDNSFLSMLKIQKNNSSKANNDDKTPPVSQQPSFTQKIIAKAKHYIFAILFIPSKETV